MHRHFLPRIALMIALSSSLAGPAQAEIEASLGWVDEIDGRQSAMATLAWVDGPRPRWEVLLGNLRGRDLDPGGAVATPTTTFLAVSRRSYWRRWYLSSGIALADTAPENPVLSGHLQFFSGVGWLGDGWTMSVRHLSNANTRGENRGETFLLIGRHW